MGILIQAVTPDMLPMLDAALIQLSHELGDTHRADRATLQGALFGAQPVCHAIVAHHDNSETPLGAALYSTMFSTSLGCTGVYVSDLWVCADARGQSLGRRLLAQVVELAGAQWQVGFIRLVAYNDNAPALAFYKRLGFEISTGESGLILRGDRFDNLGESG